MSDELYMVFDVESVGLHGIGFAWGFVVVDGEGNELDSGYAAIKPDFKGVDKNDEKFVLENVFPALWGWTHLAPPTPEGAKVPNWQEELSVWRDFRSAFWNKWLAWKEKGAKLVSDCAWPVEANFLHIGVADARESGNSRKWDGPYPLLDVSSVLLAAGKDPVGTFERQRGELPAHNPLCDARQSARVFIETLKELRNSGQ